MRESSVRSHHSSHSLRAGSGPRRTRPSFSSCASLGLHAGDAEAAGQLRPGDGPGDATQPRTASRSSAPLRSAARQMPLTQCAARPRAALSQPAHCGGGSGRSASVSKRSVQLVAERRVREGLLDHLGQSPRGPRAQGGASRGSSVRRSCTGAASGAPPAAASSSRRKEQNSGFHATWATAPPCRAPACGSRRRACAAAGPAGPRCPSLPSGSRAASRGSADGRRHDGPGGVSLALRLRREDLRQQVVGAHAQAVEGTSCRRASARRRAIASRPAPAHPPHRACSAAWWSISSMAPGARKSKMVSSGSCSAAQREEDALVGGGRLQLEVEGAAEALAQRQPKARFCRAPKGACTMSCMRPLVEEALAISVFCVGSAPARARAAQR